MNIRLKQILKDLLPPFLLKFYHFIKSKQEDLIRFEGFYPSWEEALKDSGGYDSDLILSKTKNALLKVKNGKAVYERDSVLFDKIEYSFPVLSVLLRTALVNNGRLNVLDFGGSLGSSYYQCREFLANIKQLRWNIVEQDKTVTCGKELFENDELKFFYNIDEYLECGKPDVVLLSSVLEYLRDPLDFLRKLLRYDFSTIVFDRTIVTDNHPTRLTVQKVPSHIYNASYPCWILNQEQLLGVFKNKYELLCESESPFGTIHLGSMTARWKGYVFQYKKGVRCES